MTGHPDGLPDLFLDRSLGRHQVPALLRARGLRLQTLAEVYGVPQDEQVTDVEWLRLAGDQGWAVFMKDQRIRYRPAEREVVLRHGVQAFCLTGGSLRAVDMAQQFLQAIDAITVACGTKGPAVYAVSGTGLRQITL